MKTHNILFTVVSLMFVFVSCSDIELEKRDLGMQLYPNLTRLGLTKAHEEIATSQADFGVSFFKSIAKENNYKNVVVSPFSMSLDLAMLASGAIGKTYTELVAGLGFEGFTTEQIGEYYSAILKENSSSLSSVFKTANAMWVNTFGGQEVNEFYIDEVKKFYDASVERYDFSKTPMKAVINEWADKNTNGLIPKFLDDNPSEKSPLLLTNALYFKGQWASYVPYSKTYRTFTDIKGHKVECDYFTGKISSLQSYNTKWDNPKESALLSLYYGDGFRMNVIVPPAGEQFRNFVKSLSAEYIRSLLYKQLSNDNVDLNEEINFYLPSFKIEYDANERQCKNALNDAGIIRIYSDEAELDKISGGTRVKQVIQKALVDVNEGGTEAAAVTYIETMGYIAPAMKKSYDFVVDRPFVYIIMDKYQSILFMGTVTGID